MFSDLHLAISTVIFTITVIYYPYVFALLVHILRILIVPVSFLVFVETVSWDFWGVGLHTQNWTVLKYGNYALAAVIMLPLVTEFLAGWIRVTGAGY